MATNWKQLGLRPHLSKNERLPRSYKEVEKVLKDVKACKGNLKTVLNNSRLRGPVFKKVYSLAANVLKHRHILDRIIHETELLKKETFLREELAGILIYELVFGKGLPGESRPIVVVNQYEDSIRKAYENAMKDGNLNVKGLQSLPRYVRVNTLLTSVSDVLKNLRKAEYREVYYGESTSEKEYLDLVRNLESGNYLIDYHFKDLLVFASTENLTTWSLYQKNHVYIQDKSSYIPVHALDPKPGSVVIDACAAPGMKTIHIAAAMENNGKIFAYEKSENRFEILKDMLDRATVEICEAECGDFYLVNASDPKFADLECILVDPSCSGSGMVNRMDTVTDTEDSKNTFRLQKLAGFQILLLKHALTFPSVKRVVYSTCSISEEENEYVVHEVLNHFRHMFKLVSVMPNWQTRGSDKFEFGNLCLRAHPEETLTNGFFVAMFERMDYDEQLNAPRPFSDKSSRRKRKQKENFDGRNGGSNGIGHNENETEDNPQLLGDGSSTESQTFASGSFSDKSPKKKRKQKENLDGRNSGSNGIGYDENEPEDKPQLLDDSSNEPGIMFKKKRKREYTDFHQDNTLYKDEDGQLEKVKIKKKKHSGENNDNLESRTETRLVGYESNSNFPFDVSNNPDESSFTSSVKKKKKKHKKEKSDRDDNREIDCVEIEIKEQITHEKGLDENQVVKKAKKHKHKKQFKEEAEHNLEYVSENSFPECEMTFELKDTPGRKHKKHSKKDVADLNCEGSQDVEETSLKKKH